MLFFPSVFINDTFMCGNCREDNQVHVRSLLVWKVTLYLGNLAYSFII